MEVAVPKEMRTRVWALFLFVESGMSKAFKSGVKLLAERGSKPIRYVTAEQARLMEEMGAWRPEFDQVSGVLLHYRLIGVELQKVDADLKSIHTTAAISPHEMELNVVRSRTKGLREEARLTRIKAGEFPEDPAERVQAKVRVYAVIGAGRSDILRVWPK